MKKLLCLSALLLVAVSCTNSEMDPGSRQEEEFSDKLFKEQETPDNLDSDRGSSEVDAVGTEDAIVH